MARRHAGPSSQTRSIIALVIALMAAASGLAHADSPCTPVSSTVVTNFVPCPSGIPTVCTSGTVNGSGLSGETFFVLTDGDVRGVNTRFQGIFIVQTGEAMLTFTTIGILNSVTGRFAETFTLVSATGPYAGATGHLVSTGVSTATGFAGDVYGIICTVD